MEESTIKKHVSLVAALHIGFSTIGIVGAFIVFFAISFAASFVNEADIAASVLKFVGTLLPFIILIASLAGLIGGIGLLSYRRWARILVLIMAVLGCLNFPLGTLKGVYSLWVLMQDETVKYFN